MKENRITITKRDGNKSEMLITATFTRNNNNYIIFSDLKKENYYIGKYDNLDNPIINTNLTNEELVMCNHVFEELQNEKA